MIINFKLKHKIYNNNLSYLFHSIQFGHVTSLITFSIVTLRKKLKINVFVIKSKKLNETINLKTKTNKLLLNFDRKLI